MRGRAYIAATTLVLGLAACGTFLDIGSAPPPPPPAADASPGADSGAAAPAAEGGSGSVEIPTGEGGAAQCNADVACPAGSICYPDQTCHLLLENKAECTTSYQCASGLCAPDDSKGSMQGRCAEEGACKPPVKKAPGIGTPIKCSGTCCLGGHCDDDTSRNACQFCGTAGDPCDFTRTPCCPSFECINGACVAPDPGTGTVTP